MNRRSFLGGLARAAALAWGARLGMLQKIVPETLPPVGKHWDTMIMDDLEGAFSMSPSELRIWMNIVEGMKSYGMTNEQLDAYEKIP